MLHIDRVCRSAPTQAQRGRGFPNRGRSSHPGYRRVDRGCGFRGRNSTNQVVFDAPAPDNTDYDIYKVDVKPSINVQRGVRQPPILANVLLNGQPLALEIDTGAATSLINEETYRNLWENPPVLQPAHECLRSYLGEKIPLLGSTSHDLKGSRHDNIRSRLLPAQPNIHNTLYGSTTQLQRTATYNMSAMNRRDEIVRSLGDQER